MFGCTFVAVAIAARTNYIKILSVQSIHLREAGTILRRQCDVLSRPPNLERVVPLLFSEGRAVYLMI